MQFSPWIPASTNLPAAHQSSVRVLFETGLADPRGCEYREIEVTGGDVFRSGGIRFKTRGWVIPRVKSSQTNYAIGWNGSIYAVLSVGEAASLEQDAASMIQSTRVLQQGQFTEELVMLATQWLTPVKAAMILRVAPQRLVEDCSRLIGEPDPFLGMATDRLWTGYDLAVGAHMRGDDDLAYAKVLELTRARATCEAEAKQRGFTFMDSPRWDDAAPDEPRPTALSYFEFLNDLPLLLNDQERRHNRRVRLRDPATIKNKSQRIEALIAQLENVSAIQVGRHTVNDLTRNPIVLALLKEDWDAVNPLLECYEHDDRLTRIVPVSLFRRNIQREILTVREPAYVALEGILGTTQFAPTGGSNADVAKMREYWKRYNGLSREDRLYEVLRDDQGRWLEAASLIVQPTNQPILPFPSWPSTSWSSPFRFDDPTPLRGASLRSKSNPSVTDLLVLRIRNIIANGRRGEDDASHLNEACNLAVCLARWDPKSALEELQSLSELSFRTLSPTNVKSFVSHSQLGGQLACLITLRAHAGDDHALAEYAAWLKTANPSQYSWQLQQILDPLKAFPTNAAWSDIWEFIFEDKQSRWFDCLRRKSSPGRKEQSTFDVDQFFGTPIINNRHFRKFVLGLLADRSLAGTIQGGWLRQDLSIHRQYGYTVTLPSDGTNYTGAEFRTCDFYAWLLSHRLKGTPVFELYWPEPKRNETIEALASLLQPESPPLQTQPFQEP